MLIFLSPLYSDMFGEDSVDFKDKSNLSVTVDGKTTYINLETRVSVMDLKKVLRDLPHFEQDMYSTPAYSC